jgi:hypothetical protein
MYRDNEITYGANEITYGANEITYGANEITYGANEITYGANEITYGDNEITYGANEITCENKAVVKNQPPSTHYTGKLNSLFWCFYIHVHGQMEFNRIPKNKQSTIELSEHQKMIEFMRTHPSALKSSTNHKMTNIQMQKVLSDLMVMGKKTNPDLLVVYSVYYNVPLIVFFKTVYLEVIPEDATKESLVLEFDKARGYGLSIEKEIEKDQKLLIETWTKPLKSVTHYKVSDLEKMVNILFPFPIEEPMKKVKKADLYQKVEQEWTLLLRDWIFI